MRFHFNYTKLREFGRMSYDSLKLFTLLHFGLTYGYSFSFCVGPSMLPTINERGDLVFIDHISYTLLQKDYQKGDVVICVSPYDRKKNVCKRITAIEGDIISIQTHNFPFREIIVIPKGHVWLAGDNPSNSTDSRQYGPVSMGLIQGRVMAKFTPTKWWLITPIPNGSAPPPSSSSSSSTSPPALKTERKESISSIHGQEEKTNVNVKDRKNNENDHKNENVELENKISSVMNRKLS